MNREGAETYLRLLAESEIRRPTAQARERPWAGAGGSIALLTVVSQALIAVHALEEETAEDILADFDLAVHVRQRQGRPAGSSGVTGPRPGRLRFPMTGPMIPGSRRPRSGAAAISAAGPQSDPPRPGGSEPGGSEPGGSELGGSEPGGTDGPEQSGPERSGPERSGPEPPRPAGPDRFVPVGVGIPYRDVAASGEAFLLSFAHTAAGARFAMAWRAHSSYDAQPVYPGMLRFDSFTVTDDRGCRYQLDFAGSDGPEWPGDICLRPEPPEDLRWLDISAPGGPSVRVDLTPADPAEPEISQRPLSPGEHLLIMLAERLLTVAPNFPHDLRRQLAAISPGPLPTMAAGLGLVIAALEAADVLSPLSPVPGQVAAVCAGMRVGGHGIDVPPARDLPEPWLNLLAHYHRRKPAVPVHDGYAAVAEALPELDGIRLVLLGLLNADGSSWIQLLARGLVPDQRPGPYGIGYYFPLSFWIRDSGGHWHAGRPAHGPAARGEGTIKLELVPPLARFTAWIEVLAAGTSTQVRVRLPLRWGTHND